MTTTYLRPTAPIASDVLLPANPADAMALAQRVIEGPLMSNHSHGLWGYSGPAATGAQLTIQSTGIGGPSAAAVVFELARHGVRRAIRLGHGRTLREPAADGPVGVAAALRGDGASRALGAGESALPDPELTRSLQAALGGDTRAVTVLSRDLHDPPPDPRSPAPWPEAAVGDLETAAVLAAGERAGVAVAGALITADGNDDADRDRLLELGSACVSALATVPEATR